MSVATELSTEHEPDRPLPLTEDVYTLTNAQSATLLDRYCSIEPNVAVCSPQPDAKKGQRRLAQYWRIVPALPPAPADAVFIENLCDDWRLTQNGGYVPCIVAYPDPADMRQAWIPQAVGPNISFVSAANRQLCLDLQNGSDSPKTPVLAYGSNGGLNQQWKLTSLNANIPKITANDIELVAETRFADSNLVLYRQDDTFGTVTPKVVSDSWKDSILNPANKDHVAYVAQTFDCDDFALTMKGVMAKWWYENQRMSGLACAFGLIWVRIPFGGGGHAYNFYFDRLWRMYLMEPQTGRSFTMLEVGQAVFFLYL